MYYGFSSAACNLIRNYFTNRQQIVRIGEVQSEPAGISMGVPQGSVLGPLLFLIFINDLPYFLKELVCKMFADDTTIYKAGYDIPMLIQSFIKLLRLLDVWCTCNKLEINWSKTFGMLISARKSTSGLPEFLEFNGKRIQLVKSFKLLGFTIDNELKFMEHAINTCKSVNMRLHSISRIFYACNSVKIQFFKSFILPYFDYCISLCIYFPKTTLMKLQRCYNRCLYKLFYFDYSHFESPNDFNSFLSAYNLINRTAQLV